MSEIPFKIGELVVYDNPRETEFQGLYEFLEEGEDNYKLTAGSTGLIINVPKRYVKPITYALFVRVPEGWPIVVPTYEKKSMNKHMTSTMYKFVEEGTANEIALLHYKIMKEIEDKEKKG